MSEKTTAVIAQPTYLPWLGYFDLMDQSDVFIFLDDVQFSRQSWQQRNRIRTDKGLEWLTLPVPKKGVSQKAIKEVPLALSDKFPRVHLAGIEQHYAACPFFSDYFDAVRQIMDAHGANTDSQAPCAGMDARMLAHLTTELIQWQAACLGIDTRILNSSQLHISGQRTERLVSMCKAVNADHYLSPAGSADYLINEYAVFELGGIELQFHHYEHPVYRQHYAPFEPYACALDLMFNHGPDSLEIIRSGRRESLDIRAIESGSTKPPLAA